MNLSRWHRAGLVGLMAAILTFAGLAIAGGRLTLAALFVPFLAYVLVRDEYMAHARRHRR